MYKRTFISLWKRAVVHASTRTFLIWEKPDGKVESWTYDQFDHVVENLARWLASSGVRHGSFIYLLLNNSPAFVALWLSAIRLGAVMVPADPKSTAREIAIHIEKTKPLVAFCTEANAGVCEQAVLDVPAHLRPSVIKIDESGLEGFSDAFCDVNMPLPEEKVDPKDFACVMFTSGTTSSPKGVVVTQANYAWAGEVMSYVSYLTSNDRQLVVLPLFHANAQYYSFASAIAVGASVALMPRFSASQFLEVASKYNATHASLFAAPIRMILARSTGDPKVKLKNVWYAQNITADEYEHFSHLVGCKPRQLYGMTETIPAVITNPLLEPRHNAMGMPTIGCEVSLMDLKEPKVISEPGVVGQIVVKGERGISLFLEYLGDPETTENSFVDGWFLTGDLAYKDNDGYFYFHGRKSEILKVSGENVSTVEIEAVLAEHPDVLEAAVVGEKDPIRDEVPVAFVVLKPSADKLSEEDLLKWCSQRLSSVKVPRKIFFVSELPRTSVGKIRKFMLRKQA